MGNRNKNARRWAVVALVAMMAMAAGQGAAAATVTFDFNALTDGRGNAEVQTYMRGVLAGAGLGADAVGVSGAKASKADKGKSVDGEGAPDAFILSAGVGTIVITFDSPVYGVRFDYELLPDVQCTNGSNAQNCSPPAFSFVADAVERFQAGGAVPDAGKDAGPPGQLKKTGGPATPAPPAWGASGWWEFPQGVKRLEFRNGSGSTGIDNLQVTAAPPAALSIAEPATFVLLGIGLAGIGYARRRNS